MTSRRRHIRTRRKCSVWSNLIAARRRTVLSGGFDWICCCFCPQIRRHQKTFSVLTVEPTILNRKRQWQRDTQRGREKKNKILSESYCEFAINFFFFFFVYFGSRTLPPAEDFSPKFLFFRRPKLKTKFQENQWHNKQWEYEPTQTDDDSLDKRYQHVSNSIGCCYRWDDVATSDVVSIDYRRRCHRRHQSNHRANTNGTVILVIRKYRAKRYQRQG